MARTQIEILVESIANLHIQLSASLARESSLIEENHKLAQELTNVNNKLRGPAANHVDSDLSLVGSKPRIAG